MNEVTLKDQLAQLLDEDPAAVEARSRTLFDELTAPCNNCIVLFGAGNLGKKALRVLRAHGIEPLAFCDNGQRLWGTTVDGLRVLSPADAAKQYGANAAFVITVYSDGVYFLDLRKQLQELDCAHVFPLPALLWKFSAECLPHVLLDLPQKIIEQKLEVQYAFDLLADDRSRREYVGQIRWRLWQDYEALPSPIKEDQYFPEDLFDFSEDEIFVDCGAFDGDTLRTIIHRKKSFHRIFAFEPDPATFDRLEDCVSHFPEAERAKILNRRIAVGASKGKVLFDAAGTLGSKISGDGTVEVECDTLDALLVHCRPTFIKMDIEGAEIAALSGGTQTLKSARAIWAVCVYHKPRDIWEIPLLIESMREDVNYSYFLRKYGSEAWETVLYAVPQQRVKTVRGE